MLPLFTLFLFPSSSFSSFLLPSSCSFLYLPQQIHPVYLTTISFLSLFSSISTSKVTTQTLSSISLNHILLIHLHLHHYLKTFPPFQRFCSTFPPPPPSHTPLPCSTLSSWASPSPHSPHFSPSVLPLYPIPLLHLIFYLPLFLLASIYLLLLHYPSSVSPPHFHLVLCVSSVLQPLHLALRLSRS